MQGGGVGYEGHRAGPAVGTQVVAPQVGLGSDCSLMEKHLPSQPVMLPYRASKHPAFRAIRIGALGHVGKKNSILGNGHQIVIRCQEVAVIAAALLRQKLDHCRPVINVPGCSKFQKTICEQSFYGLPATPCLGAVKGFFQCLDFSQIRKGQRCNSAGNAANLTSLTHSIQPRAR